MQLSLRNGGLEGIRTPLRTPLRMIIDHAEPNPMAAEVVATVSDRYTVEVPLEAHMPPTRMSRNISPNSTATRRGSGAITAQLTRIASATT
jgi:hypothetical protein